MTLQEIADQLSLTVRTAPHRLTSRVKGGYASDMLSHVMAKAHAGDLWITIQTHPNIVDIAVLLDLAGIIITEDKQIDPATIEKAQSEQVPILTTAKTTFTTAGELFRQGLPGVDEG